MSHPEPPSTPSEARRRRAPGIALLALVAASAIGGAVLYHRWAGGVTTDDAFVKADTVQVAAEVGGRVVEVAVRENQPVHAGDLLVRIDSSDYALRVVQAEANLAATEADARRADAAISVSRSDLKTGEVRLSDAERENHLQSTLQDGGAAAPAVADRARAAAAITAQTLETARVGVSAAEAGREAARARVETARAALDLAKRDLALTEVRAPRDGVAAKVDAAVGELAQRGTPLCVIVPTEVYVVASFKETDLAAVAPGRPAVVTLDAWPDLDLAGMVESIGAGTGASFSLLPADNASGNFIKVVQRVPVRITLDRAEIDGRPIPVGVSALVRVPRAGTGS